MKNLQLFVVLASLLVLSAGCGSSVQVNTPDSAVQLSAPGSNPFINQPDARGRVAQSVAGLWHGFIAPVTLLISFFNSNVQMYEVHNAGSTYDLGFLVGMALTFLVLGLLRRKWR